MFLLSGRPTPRFARSRAQDPCGELCISNATLFHYTRSEDVTLIRMEKTEGLKRKALNDGDYARKTKKQWRTPKKKPSSRPAPTLDPEGAGIWATCDMHKEGRATTELRDLFEDYAAQIYGQLGAQSPDRTFDGEISKHTQSLDSPCEEGVQLEEQSDELEDQIAREVQLIKNPVSASTADPAVSKNLFQAVRLDTPCLLFFKTVHPIDPASFVHTICHDISIGKILRRSKYVRRLTPVSRLGKATSMGLEQVAKAVLADVFDGKQGLKVGSDFVRCLEYSPLKY